MKEIKDWIITKENLNPLIKLNNLKKSLSFHRLHLRKADTKINKIHKINNYKNYNKMIKIKPSLNNQQSIIKTNFNSFQKYKYKKRTVNPSKET